MDPTYLQGLRDAKVLVVDEGIFSHEVQAAIPSLVLVPRPLCVRAHTIDCVTRGARSHADRSLRPRRSSSRRSAMRAWRPRAHRPPLQAPGALPNCSLGAERPPTS